MKTENAHSQKVWNIFVSKIGTGMKRWNLTQWLPFSEEIVTFFLNKPNFHGVVSIQEIKEGSGKGMFAVAFQGLNWPLPAVTVLDETNMAHFIDKLGNEPESKESGWEAGDTQRRAIGERAPQDTNNCRAAG